jgi:hypothetical protein
MRSGVTRGWNLVLPRDKSEAFAPEITFNVVSSTEPLRRVLVVGRIGD